MPKLVLLDNDVALKIACYSLVDEMVGVTSVGGHQPGMLGVGRFVVRGRLERDSRLVDRVGAKAAFEKLLGQLSLLEPSEEELAIAAELEAEANRKNLELDGGESQLVAMLASRAGRLLLTGDKRAILAMAEVARRHTERRVACFEQLIAHIVALFGSPLVRDAVCSEPSTDRAVALCFCCGRATEPHNEEVFAALASYSGHLERSAPGILLPGPDLAELVG